MLGSDLLKDLKADGQTVIALTENEFNITDPVSIESACQPHEEARVLINAAAYTQVDQCESNPDLAMNVNGKGPGYLADWCRRTNTQLIHFSTDYVFDGKGSAPFTEHDAPHPINMYGKSKLAGESAIRAHLKNHVIFRIQWLFGQHGPNFIKTISEIAKAGQPLKVVNDQFGTPTWTKDVSSAVRAILHAPPSFGTYHFRNDGYTSWYDVASHIVSTLQLNTEVTPVDSTAFPRPAERPKNGRLSMDKYLNLALTKPRHWRDAVTSFLKGS